MSYRTITIQWLPESQRQWNTFTDARLEAGRLWTRLVKLHHRIRAQAGRWPAKQRLQQWAKRKFPALHSQSVQQIIADFCEAVDSARQLRKNGHPEARYPWRYCRYRDVIFTNQGATIKAHRLRLPCGAAGVLFIPLRVTLPGRLMEARLAFGEVQLVCQVPDEARPSATTIGVDIGVNSLIGATNGSEAMLISGRGVKSAIRYRNKLIGRLRSKLSKKTRGSRRSKRLMRRLHQVRRKVHRQILDACHKATHMVAEAFPHALCYVGQPFNGAAQHTSRTVSQQVSQAVCGRLTRQLDYKTSGAIQIPEPFSSQTCPVCGCRNKCRRIYVCRQCHYTAPRDMVGGANILCLGKFGELRPGQVVVLQRPTYRRLDSFSRRSPVDTRQVASG